MYIAKAISPATGSSANGVPSAVTAVAFTLQNFRMALTTPIKAPPAMKPEAIKVPRL